jgi:hypothetical protein
MPFATLSEAGGSRLGAQQFANGIDLAMGHVHTLRLARTFPPSLAAKTDDAQHVAR